MQSIGLILFTVTAQPNTTNDHAVINLTLFTVTAETHSTKAHAVN